MTLTGKPSVPVHIETDFLVAMSAELMALLQEDATYSEVHVRVLADGGYTVTAKSDARGLQLLSDAARELLWGYLHEHRRAATGLTTLLVRVAPNENGEWFCSAKSDYDPPAS